MSVSFAQARQAVQRGWPDYRIAEDGYASGGHWLLILEPVTAGGRVPAVDKATGEITWINENSPLYTEEHPVGGQVEAASALMNFREYVRDSKGQFAGTGGSPAAMHDETQLRQAYTFTDSATGYRTEVSGIFKPGDPNPDPNDFVQHPTVPPGRTMVTVRIVDAKGNQVGEACRTVHPAGQARINHNYLVLDSGTRGQGFATRFNAHTEAAYRTNGIRMITLHADIDVGGYAWARAGYDFRNNQTRSATTRQAYVESLTRGHPRSVVDRFRQLMTDSKATPLDVAMVGHTPGATLWPGKEIMLDSDWQGVKML